jgi:hypothetical protein
VLRSSTLKKILLSGILLSLLFVSHSFATANFTATSAGTTITATLSGEQGSTSNFNLIIQTTPLPTTPTATSFANPVALTQQANAQGTVTWTVPNNAPSTTYYVGVEEIPTATYLAANAAQPSYPVSTTTVTTGVAVATTSTSTNLANTDYTLLAPFPGLTDIPSANTCAQKEAAATAAGTAQPVCDVNGLLNYAMKLLIGLSGVVLVLRLMYEGYSYMVTDVPFLKASSKAGFFSALLGLLLALTSFIILNTINPKLVNETVNVSQLNIGVTEPDVDSAPLTSNAPLPPAGTAAGACTAGVTTVTVQQSSFIVCSTYNGIPFAANLQSMLTAAYAANITLGGWSFRSDAEQVALRKAHCNGDTTNKSATCTPPTALPGHSNHESGLAIDFTCGAGTGAVGSYNFKSTKCFTWLQQNAGTYKLINYSAEPWHWSWNGS